MSDFIKAENLSVYFPMRKGLHEKQYLKAVDNVSFSISKETVFGLCGESGSGKTTTGKAILDLVKKTNGQVYLDGEPVCKTTKDIRKRMQIIFQDPAGSLNPSKTILQLLMEPLRLHGLVSSKDEAMKRIVFMLGKVGLSDDILCRYPHEFSGGQLQRICICRALLVEPEFLVCDESIASLDVSIQAQIINLLKVLKKEFHLTILFISHNLAVLSYLCDEIGVMYLGNLVERASVAELLSNPLHPYTKALLSVVPIPDPDIERARTKIVLQGEIPNPVHPPLGCPFSTRCKTATDRCQKEKPAYQEIFPQHYVACFELKNKGDKE